MAGPCPPDKDTLAYGIQGAELIEISLSRNNQGALNQGCLTMAAEALVTAHFFRLDGL